MSLIFPLFCNVLLLFFFLKESEGEKSDADADPDLVVDVANEVMTSPCFYLKYLAFVFFSKIVLIKSNFLSFCEHKISQVINLPSDIKSVQEKKIN